MKVHITNIYGMSFKSVAQIAQQMVARIATHNLHFNELAIYNYNSTGESPAARLARYDGILASVSNGDIIIFQSPTWNSFSWDNSFFERTFAYARLKRIIFIHDIAPLMFNSNFYLLPKFIDFYNKADLIIVPSTKMANFLYQNGLTVKKVVIQHMWDHPSNINPLIHPHNNKVINFIGAPDKFQFVKDWNFSNTKLQLFSDNASWGKDKNISFQGWQYDPDLLNTLRRSGGFGLVWSTKPDWSKYMELNASYKLSTYLAAGIPIIANSKTPEKDTIVQHHLGIIADDLTSAIHQVENMSDTTYNQMTATVDQYAELIRQGYFTKHALIEAIFKLLYD